MHTSSTFTKNKVIEMTCTIYILKLALLLKFIHTSLVDRKLYRNSIFLVHNKLF